jgi:hypothetical protein|tara:strand:- start:1225 stop:1806 length:582 start_codon:yes stop_codon:yes gene_type:complete
MARDLLLAMLLLMWVVPLGAQEVPKGLRINVIAENDPDGILSADALRSSAILFLRKNWPDVVIDETARLYLHIEPACLAIDLSVSCTVSLAFRRLGQDFSPFRELVPASMPLAGGAAASAPDPLAEMLYWQKRALFTVPAGAEASEVNAWMGRTIDEPLASWLSLDLATRECWRDYFNKNERESPLSPCLRSP